MKAIKLSNLEELREKEIPGSYCIMEASRPSTNEPVRGFAIRCAGCNEESYLPVNKTGDKKHKDEWLWDGNENSPTLKPSVFHTKEKGGCGWHGYLTNGQWVHI